jgi:hypothetical protein
MPQEQIKLILEYWHYYMGGLLTLAEFDRKLEEIMTHGDQARLDFRATIRDIVSRLV